MVKQGSSITTTKTIVKRKALLLITVITLGGALLVAGVSLINQNRAEEAPKYGTKMTACQVLTPSIAKKVLGDTTKEGDSSTGSLESSQDMRITKCTYKSTSPGSRGFIASLVIQAPKTKQGVKKNKDYFREEKFTTAEKIRVFEKYGDARSWNVTKGELNILGDNNRYILVNGASSSGDRTLPDTQELAELLKKQF